MKSNHKPSIKLLAIDVDGVLTDGKLYYTEAGESFKVFDVKDGLGIKLAQKVIEVAVISGNSSKIIAARMKSLGVKYTCTGEKDKASVLKSLMHKLNLKNSEVAYIGDDLNDLSTRPLVGLFACPSDANPFIKKKADLILNACGGYGAVREFIDEYILKYHDIDSLSFNTINL